MHVTATMALHNVNMMHMNIMHAFIQPRTVPVSGTGCEQISCAACYHAGLPPNSVRPVLGPVVNF